MMTVCLGIDFAPQFVAGIDEAFEGGIDELDCQKECAGYNEQQPLDHRNIFDFSENEHYRICSQKYA